QLDQRRQANAMGTMLYPVGGPGGVTLCYVLHAGRAVAALPAAEPTSETLAKAAALAQARSRQGRVGDQVAGVLLLAAWFRKYPQERDRLIPADGPGPG